MAEGSWTWAYDDDVLTFYLFRCIEEGIGDDAINKKTVTDGRMKLGALRMRIGNFRYIDNKKKGYSGKKKGLSHPSKQSREVYDAYKHKELSVHRQKCLEILRNRNS